MRTIKISTSDFITEVVGTVNGLITCYYEEAPESIAVFPFAVVNGIFVTSLADGDLAQFYIDIYADEKKANSTVVLELACDTVRNGLNNIIISHNDMFAHLGFENQSTTSETEFDLAHRRISMTARIFYKGESNL